MFLTKDMRRKLWRERIIFAVKAAAINITVICFLILLFFAAN